MRKPTEHGFVLLALMVVLIPLLLVVGAFSTAATGKSSELRGELDRERALLAAESGVDDAIYRGQTGMLANGVGWQRDLGSGASFQVLPTHLKVDGLDNDADTLIDEPDEDVFQVVASGSYRGVTRRLAAYLGPVPLLPPITAAVQVQNPSLGITLAGAVEITGNNTNINGTAAPGPVPGMQIASPGTIANLAGELSPAEQSKVTGSGPAPSLAAGPGIELTSIVASVQNTANVILTANHYASANFGSGAAGVANIIYRGGDVAFSGNTTAAGIMVVTGDLHLSGTFRFDGVLIVLGNVAGTGTMDVFGALIQGPGASSFALHGNATIRYSTEAIALANSVGGTYVSFNGWQEIAS